jgi:CheY-like chemotaxis protein
MARILLAEDEMLLRELALDDLTAAGFEVVVANDGDAALAILERDRGFDLLFTDIRMPGKLDGWALAAEGRRLVPGLKVVYATGLDDGEGRVGAGEHLVPKPYRKEVLLELLAGMGLTP